MNQVFSPYYILHNCGEGGIKVRSTGPEISLGGPVYIQEYLLVQYIYVGVHITNTSISINYFHINTFIVLQKIIECMTGSII